MTLVSTAFRDFNTDGVPSSGAHEPVKKEIRDALIPIESAVNSFTANGGLVYIGRAALLADLLHAANSMAWVIGDATIAYNGIYQKTGASGAGTWTRIADLPFNVIRGEDSGAGTANAIQVVTAFPVNDGCFVSFAIFEANTASPVTVSFNGQPSLTIKTAGGSNVAAAGLTAGVQIFGLRIGSTFRLLNDQASAAIVAAAEDAADRAEAAAIDAENAASTNNKILTGSFQLRTNGARASITSGSSPFTASALLHINNENAVSAGIINTCYWTGTTAVPYINNDVYLAECHNNVVSNSANRSWGGSFANGYNNIPVGVTDSGERTGIIGWAVSVNKAGYSHAGTLTQQIGVQGSSGFQGSGTPATAVVTNATSVRGLVYNDSAGATITNAYAGEFLAASYTGNVTNNYAIFADAAGGSAFNYSFYGNRGVLWNQDQIRAGVNAGSTQSSSKISVRGSANGIEFGNPDPNGYGCNIGSTYASAYPFVAFCAEADPTGDTFRTRGKSGSIIYDNLAGGLLIGRITNANASGQGITEDARFDASGHLVLAQTPYLPTKTPASASAAGTAGEVAWDSSYIYICTATNTWKRVAIATW